MSTDFKTDPQIALIRKLLKQAESAAKIGNHAEADAFNERAAALISKYGVDQALLAERGERQDRIISKRITLGDTYTIDRRLLLHSIVKGLGAQMVSASQRRPGTTKSLIWVSHVFAHESDMDRIEFLFELLQPQMTLGAAGTQAPYWENARSFRKSWMSGFAAAIHDRLFRNEKEAASEAGTGTDLVLFDRSKAVEREYVLAYPKVHNLARRLIGTGRDQGYAAGQRASLGYNHVGGSRFALAG